MENEDFDEDLTTRIRQIFEDYDDGQANAGWNLLREKYPEKNRRYHFFWWISAAVLLFAVLLFWFFQPENDEVRSAKNLKTIKPDSVVMQAKSGSSAKKLFAETDSFNSSSGKKTLLKTAPGFTFKQKPAQQKTPVYNFKNTTAHQTNADNDAVFTGIKSDSVNDKNYKAQALDLIKADSVHQKSTQTIDSASNQLLKSATKKELVKAVSGQKINQKKSGLGWSFYVGPHLNFAQSSNTQLGFEAGLSANFHLNNKLKLATGFGLMQHKLSYQNNANNNFYASLPANSASNSSGGINVSSTSLNRLDASLLQLDVPINLIYDILPGKNSMAIMAGLSSGTFARESYQYNYANAANDVQSSKSFQSFYLMKTLNIAAQFGLPIYKYNLQLEPFVKVPLGNLASEQLKFGAAGINLRFKFQSVKK